MMMAERPCLYALVLQEGTLATTWCMEAQAAEQVCSRQVLPCFAHGITIEWVAVVCLSLCCVRCCSIADCSCVYQDVPSMGNLQGGSVLGSVGCSQLLGWRTRCGAQHMVTWHMLCFTMMHVCYGFCGVGQGM